MYLFPISISSLVSYPLKLLTRFLKTSFWFYSVQFSHVQLFVTPWTAAFQASWSITDSWSLLKLMSIELVMPSNHLILCHPLLLLPSFFPSIRVFSKESVFRIRWPKYWSFSFSISPSSEYWGLISFRMDWLDLLAVQRTLILVLLMLSIKRSLCILGNGPLSDCAFFKSVACLPIFFDIVFHSWIVIFGAVSKKASPYSRSSGFSPVLSSKGFMCLCFICRSMIHFWDFQVVQW